MDFRITKRGQHEQLTATDIDPSNPTTSNVIPSNVSGLPDVEPYTEAPSRRQNYNRRGKYTRNKYAWSRMEREPKHYTGRDPIRGDT